MEHLLLAFTTFAFKTQRGPLMDTTTTKCLNGKLLCKFCMHPVTNLKLSKFHINTVKLQLFVVQNFRETAKIP